jgi:hypothetical protein
VGGGGGGGGGGVGGWSYNINDLIFVFHTQVELFCVHYLFCVCTILMLVFHVMLVFLLMIIGSVIKTWHMQENDEE